MSLPARFAFWLKEAAMHRGTIRHMSESVAHQRLPREAIDRLAWRRLGEVVRFAASHVPHYQRMWAEHDIEAALENPEAFATLPVSERNDIAVSGRDLVATGTRGRLVYTGTSGSSGIRLYFWSDPMRAGWSAAARVRARRMWNVEPGSRTARYCRTRYPGQNTLRRRAQYWGNVIGNRLCGISRVSAYDMTAEDMLADAQEIDRMRPEMITGYGGSLGRLALFMRERGMALPPGRLKVTTFYSDPTTDEGRQAMVEVFGAPVASEYACRESGLVAHECLNGNLHIADDNLLVETVDAKGRPVVGEPGEVILSDLRLSRTPYLRYRLGDVATLAPADYVCPCGCPQRVMTELVGRTHDMVPLRDGGALPPYFIATVLKTMPNIQHYQTRLRGSTMRILVETTSEQLAPVRDQIIAWAEERVNHEYVVTLEAVPRIEPMSSGKYATLVLED